MNIVYNSNNIRLIQFNSNQVYQIEEINFYIPKEFESIYLRLRTSENEDIVKLIKEKEEGGYSIYKIPLTLNFRVNSECELTLLLAQGEILISELIGIINLKSDNLSAIKKLQFMEEVSDEVKLACRKIEEYTKLNIQILKDIEEARTHD